MATSSKTQYWYDWNIVFYDGPTLTTSNFIFIAAKWCMWFQITHQGERRNEDRMHVDDTVSYRVEGNDSKGVVIGQDCYGRFAW